VDAEVGVRDWLFDVDWQGLLAPTASPIEIFVRGTVIYLGLFALLRGVLKREAGTVGITDLLVVVLLADAAQNSLAPESKSLPDGLLLVASIVFWAYLLNWLGFRFPTIQKLVHPRPLPLVRDGEMLRRNMRKELVTEDELMTQLRLQGCDDLASVKAAYMEGDGRISVITGDGETKGAPERAGM
jgi:uncharacterized membrane protein YcaP (DUF421 family)